LSAVSSPPDVGDGNQRSLYIMAAPNHRADADQLHDILKPQFFKKIFFSPAKI